MLSSERCVASLLATTETAHGRPPGSGTTLVVDPERDGTGSVTCYASGRPHDVEPSFDDIAVLTHPAWRKRRLGALTVHEFIRHRQAEDRGLRAGSSVASHR